MKIYGIYNVSNTNSQIFLDNTSANINLLQNDGQEVEVQYKVNDLGMGQILYSALIIGRK